MSQGTLRPNLMLNTNKVPKLKDFRGEKAAFPDYEPSYRVQLANAGHAIGISFFISTAWAAIDGCRAFPFWPLVVVILDVAYVLHRCARYRSMSLPKMPLLYLPFTTVAILGVVFPTVVYTLLGACGWMGCLAGVAFFTLLGLARRLIEAATDQQESDPAIAHDFAVQFRKARENPSRYWSSRQGVYLLDPPAGVDRITVDRFDTRVTRVLGFRVENCYSFPCVVLFLFAVGIYLAASETQFPTEMYLRFFWPVVAAASCCGGVFNLLTRRGREQFGFTAWAIQVFANTLPYSKDETADWTPHSRYGHRSDRRAYLFFKTALIAVVLLQLLVCGPAFIGSLGDIDPNDYPSAGTNLAMSAKLSDQTDSAWNVPRNQVILLAVAHMVVPPVLMLFPLVALCGERLRLGYELLCSDEAVTHESVRIPGREFNQDFETHSTDELA